jgi:hypothetical protein
MMVLLSALALDVASISSRLLPRAVTDSLNDCALMLTWVFPEASGAAVISIDRNRAGKSPVGS